MNKNFKIKIFLFTMISTTILFSSEKELKKTPSFAKQIEIPKVLRKATSDMFKPKKSTPIDTHQDYETII